MSAPSLPTTLKRLGSLVRLSHTVFGLPFALAAAGLAHRSALAHGGEGLTLARLGLILLAFTGARTAAMGFNRIVDRGIDGENPRTAGRELPAGLLSLRAAWLLTALSALAFVFAAWSLGPVPLYLSPICLLVILGYSLFKRFSWSAHLVLGLALALAPGGAWVAITGSLDDLTTPLWLMLAVACWVAGFDVLYSLQDESFDRARDEAVRKVLDEIDALTVPELLVFNKVDVAPEVAAEPVSYTHLTLPTSDLV